MPSPHFPGSFPCASAEEVFAWVGRTLGDRTRLVPDGETDENRRRWQPYLPWFERNPTLDHDDPIPMGAELDHQYKLKPGTDPAFDEPFEYQDWARASYAVFTKVREQGGLPATAKLMVAMPHTIDTVMSSATGDAFMPIYEAYKKQLLASIEAILAGIPHEDLAIQWDTVSIPLAYGEYAEVLPVSREFVVQEIAGHADLVPEDVEVGFHICFGDGNNPETVGDERPDEEMPPDASILVPMANDVVKAARRQLSFLHLPTYQNWREPEQYEPLQALELRGADLSLGVITLRRDPDVETGIEHARQRAASAREALGPVFGIATTCGMGRFTPKQFEAAALLYDELQQH